MSSRLGSRPMSERLTGWLARFLPGGPVSSIVAEVATGRQLVRRGKSAVYSGKYKGFQIELAAERELTRDAADADLARVSVTFEAPLPACWELHASIGFLSSAYTAAIVTP